MRPERRRPTRGAALRPSTRPQRRHATGPVRWIGRLEGKGVGRLEGCRDVARQDALHVLPEIELQNLAPLGKAEASRTDPEDAGRDHRFDVIAVGPVVGHRDAPGTEVGRITLKTAAAAMRLSPTIRCRQRPRTSAGAPWRPWAMHWTHRPRSSRFAGRPRNPDGPGSAEPREGRIDTEEASRRTRPYSHGAMPWLQGGHHLVA